MANQSLDEEDQKYLFVLSPPFCGSTLLWRILGTSPSVSSLPREGQCVESVDHVMPGTILLEHPEYDVPWNFVKERWKEKWNLNQPVLLEKSPSNIHRAFEIQKHFSPASFVALIRDPYAFCEGCTRRKQHFDYQDSAQFWVKCAESQKRNVRRLERVVQVRYEDLTECTEDTLQRIVEFMPQLQTLRRPSGTTFTLMGRQSEIRNVNEAKLNRLVPRDVRMINEVLSQHRGLLSFFGYEMRKPTDQSVLGAWKARATTTSLRGMRWLVRKGVVPGFIAERVEKVVST